MLPGVEKGIIHLYKPGSTEKEVADCVELSKHIKAKIPHIDYMINETARGCVLDYEDKQLKDVALEISKGSFSSVYATRGSVAIYDDMIEADVPISVLVNVHVPKKYRSELTGTVAYSDEDDIICLIKAVHAHDSEVPSVHVHFECDIRHKKESEKPVFKGIAIERIARTIEYANEVGRHLAGLDIKEQL